MAEHSTIEWTDATWNPITGCSLVSEGCRHCYAATLAATRLKNHPSRKGLARLNAAGEAKFTGEVRFNDEWLGQPLPNVWLGTSVEDQATADARIPHLLDAPAAMRFVSAEPLLGPVDLTVCPRDDALLGYAPDDRGDRHKIDWVIVGGESGHGARPMHPDWARSLRDQCQAAGVAFFFKQWGAWAPNETQGADYAQRVGKSRAGRLLDGREWNEVPDWRTADPKTIGPNRSTDQ